MGLYMVPRTRARGFHAAMCAIVDDLAPLPEPMPIGGPEQISLF